MTPKRNEQVREAMRRWRKRHPQAAKTKTDDWRRAHPAMMLVRAARRRAKRKGIPCTITWNDISPLPSHCPVLGYRLRYYGSNHGRDLYKNRAAASLDRIKNSRGYVPGNVIVISLRANLLKGQATLIELQKIAAFFGRYVS